MIRNDGFHALNTLLSQVVYHPDYDGLEGLNPIRALLDKDADGIAAVELLERLPTLPEKVRGGIAFVLARSFLQQGNLEQIQQMYQAGDVVVQEAVLNGLWGKPSADESLGDRIVALAVEGMGHPASEVRSQAANVIKNQAAWGVRIETALSPLGELLADPCASVRHAATYGVGVIAKKRKTDLTLHLDRVISNLSHEDRHVREASAWALWQLSRRYDIGAAVTDLVRMLAHGDQNDGPSKNAAGALLHHARKSSLGRAAVRLALAARPLDVRHRANLRLQEQLDTLESAS